MQSKARLIDVGMDYISRKTVLTIEIPTSNDELEKLRDIDLDLVLKKHFEPRSMNANKLFHCLSDKLADALRMSKPMCKNMLLWKYGQKWRDDDGHLIVIKTNAPEKELLESKDLHFWGTRPAPDGTPMYILLRHSSTYDSREMSILIDGTIADCKEAGVDTTSPEEIEKAKALWGLEIG